MELCPKCRTGLYLKESYETENEVIVIQTCRNPSCSSYMKDVEVIRVPREVSV